MRLPSRGGFSAVAALLAGAVVALAFPAPSLWWIAPLALVPWLLLLSRAPDRRHAARDGWLGGTGLMLATHQWLVPELHLFLLPLAALVGVLWAPWGVLVHHLLAPPGSVRRTAMSLVLVPAAWIAAEWVRSSEFLGGPWGLLGASQWQQGPALRLMSWGGVWLVSLVLVLVNTAAVALFLSLPSGRGQRPDGGHARSGATACCGLLVAALAWSAGSWWLERPGSAGTVTVAVVQPGVVEGVRARFARQLELSRGLAGQPVDLVVWGESGVGFDPAARPGADRSLREVSALLDAPLLINVDARRPGGDGIRKSAVVVDRSGPTGERYDKMRLVPFGEYIPARGVLGWAASVGRAAEEDRRPGSQQRLLDTGGLRVGPLVCFETAFPDMSRQLTRKGARLLVAQSSTSTFQESWAPRQHASLGALRAAESGRSVVHGTLTGVSAVYGPDGSQVGPSLGTGYSGARVHTVPLGADTTPYVRFGDWVVWLSLVSLAAGAAFGRRPRPRAGRLRRRRAGRS